MDTTFHFFRGFIFLFLASFASSALSVTVSSELGRASLDGAWAFEDCFYDPEEFDVYYKEYLIFRSNEIESRLLGFGEDETCSGIGARLESETFNFTDEGDVQTLGWDGDQPMCQDPDACEENDGLLNDTPLATEIAILITGEEGEEDETETILWYVDDTGETWYLYRNAGEGSEPTNPCEEDDPTCFMSPEEPLLRVSPAIVSVSIDIKPGSDPNSINPRSKGVIPVAVLGSIDFDATQVDPTKVTFGPNAASPAHNGHIEDVDSDGFMDAVFHFKTQETGITCGDVEAILNGEVFDGTPITGTDSVNTVGCNSAASTASNNTATTSSAGTMGWMLMVGLGVLGLWRLNR